MKHPLKLLAAITVLFLAGDCCCKPVHAKTPQRETVKAAKVQEITFDSGTEKQWGKTIKFEFQNGIATLHGTGWDSKIWKNIKLKPDTSYKITGSGEGIVTVSVWEKPVKKRLFTFNLSGPKFREQSMFFQTTKQQNQRYELYISSGKKYATTGRIKALRIEEAAEEPVWQPDMAKLRASRPDPEIVRGIGGSVTTDEGYFKQLQEWNVNALRLSVQDFRLKTNYTCSWEEQVEKMIDSFEKVIPLARKYKIKLIVLASTRNMKIKPELRRTWSFLRDPDFEREFTYFWKRIATRLRNYHDVIWAYELMNEPLDRNQLPHAPREWYPLACRLVKAIRAIDKDVWIMYEPGPGGGAGWGKNPRLIPDYKIIYSSHFYTPHAFTHQGVERLAATDHEKIDREINRPYPGKFNGVYYDAKAIDKAFAPVDAFLKKYPVPYYIGEFSAIAWGPGADQWLKDVVAAMEKRKLSWSYHCFRGWHGWNLLMEEKYPFKGQKIKYVEKTKRLPVMLEAWKKNKKQK